MNNIDWEKEIIEARARAQQREEIEEQRLREKMKQKRERMLNPGFSWVVKPWNDKRDWADVNSRLKDSHEWVRMNWGEFVMTRWAIRLLLVGFAGLALRLLVKIV
jgi:hypothetical protein